jgi:hypothetical protein
MDGATLELPQMEAGALSSNEKRAAKIAALEVLNIRAKA